MPICSPVCSQMEYYMNIRDMFLLHMHTNLHIFHHYIDFTIKNECTTKGYSVNFVNMISLGVWKKILDKCGLFKGNICMCNFFSDFL